MQLFWILLIFFSLLNQDFSGFRSEQEQDSNRQEISLPLDQSAIAGEASGALPPFATGVLELPALNALSCVPARLTAAHSVPFQALGFYLTQHGARADLLRA